MTIGKKIKKFREMYKLTQEELAKKVFLTDRAIGNYETGTREPSLEVLKKISEALSVPFDRFIKEDEIEKKPLKTFLQEKSEKKLTEEFERYLLEEPTDKLRILYADQWTMERHTKEVLERNFNAEVILVNDGEDALLMYERALKANKPFDLVVIELVLPSLSGIEALSYIVSCDKEARVVMYSILSGELTVRETLYWGAKNYILKNGVFEIPNEKSIVDGINKTLEKYGRRHPSVNEKGANL